MIFWLTLLGLVFRLIASGQSLWLDEGATYVISQVPLPHFFEYLQTDFHPPLYYLLQKFYLPLSGSSEVLARLPDILLGTATIPLLFALCQTVLGKKTKAPLLSALLLALNPLHIYYSQELRMYNLATLLVLASWFFLLRKKYLLVSLFNLLGLFTFYGVGLNLVSQSLYLFFTERKRLFRYLLTVLPAGGLFFLWWPIFSLQLSAGDIMKSSLPGWSLLSGSATLKSLFLVPLKFLVGRTNLEPQSLYLLVGGCLLLIFSLFILFSLRRPQAKPFWFFLFCPLILAFIISFKTPILGYWRYLFVLPAFVSLISVGILALHPRFRIPSVIFVCFIFLSANLFFWLSPRFQREDWRGLSAFVSGKNAALVFSFPGAFAPLAFYRPAVDLYPLQDQLGQVPVDIQDRVRTISQEHSTIFVMDYLNDLADPQRKTLEAVRSVRQQVKAVYNFNNLGQLYEF